MIQWPDFLPAPRIDGYALNPQKASQRTSMSAGPARVRRRFTRVPHFITQKWLFSEAEFGAFEQWVHDEADMGAAWWLGPARNGTGRVSVQCRFVEQDSGPYAAKLVSISMWEVSAVIEVESMPFGNPIALWAAGDATLHLDFLNQAYKVAG